MHMRILRSQGGLTRMGLATFVHEKSMFLQELIMAWASIAKVTRFPHARPLPRRASVQGPVPSVASSTCLRKRRAARKLRPFRGGSTLVRSTHPLLLAMLKGTAVVAIMRLLSTWASPAESSRSASCLPYSAAPRFGFFALSHTLLSHGMQPKQCLPASSLAYGLALTCPSACSAWDIPGWDST